MTFCRLVACGAAEKHTLQGWVQPFNETVILEAAQ